MRKLLTIAALHGLLLMTACSDGGSSGAAASANSAPLAMAPAAGAPAAANVVPLVIDSGPNKATSLRPFISVTLCAPGDPSNCQTIDHVMVDTGSSGLHIASSAVNAKLKQALKPIADPKVSGNVLALCEQYVTSFNWGSLVSADVQIGGESAAAVPTQLQDDPSFSKVPADCSDGHGTQSNSDPAVAGVNGLIGASLDGVDNGSYYSCPAAGCTGTELNAPVATPSVSPQTKFAVDNNGVIIDLPAVPVPGVTTLTGSMTFGIGTQSNNQLQGVAAKVYPVLTNVFGNALLKTTFSGHDYNYTFIDSGSAYYSFNTPDVALLPQCPSNLASYGGGFYCPASAVALSAVLTGNDGTVSVPMDFSIGNAEQILSTNNAALNGLGSVSFDGGALNVFDWPLQFFYGRRMYFSVKNGKTTAGPDGKQVGNGFYAFKS
ncbi:DUF3443 family protein [Collimonas pratensis]|uniref:DUF3443 family protein n=1 Tax=Collimonas pratensis TaxID=279113 RepID=A0ABM5Z5R7_9BURK|nr:DUF3443 family protein [Collimonas pratensis]AMP14201.1 hypothetical protein CPter291_1935 [Collimonas pratensis]NKI68791.1 DUF3443 family protein [Collimonas pratensis]